MTGDTLDNPFHDADFLHTLQPKPVQAAAQILDIALTKRGKHEGNDIPMCGVPVHFLTF